MTVTITPVNALRYADEIKGLFLANQRPEFPDAFDRAYPQAFAAGGGRGTGEATSWVGRDPSGRLVMHIACLARRFRFGTREVVGGLTANLMVAPEYRSFFPAMALVQQLIRDSRAAGTIDFLYTDPNEHSGVLLRGTRFARVGTLRRFVLPIADRRRHVDLALRLLHGLAWVATRTFRRSTVLVQSAREFAAETLRVPDAGSSRLSAYHDPALYASRLAGYPGDRDWWFTCHRNGGGGRPDGGLLIRGPDATGLAVLHAARRRANLSLAAFLPDVTAELRRRGGTGLQVTTVAESDLARELRRCGFVPRNDRVALFALALTPAGEECVRSLRRWEITDLECDR